MLNSAKGFSFKFLALSVVLTSLAHFKINSIERPRIGHTVIVASFEAR